MLLDNCNSSRDIRKNCPNISTGITASLGSIAIGAAAEGLITYSECQVSIQGDAKKETKSTNLVLNEVYNEINRNKEVLDKFLGILRRMGPPISHYCEPIGELALSQKTL